MQAGDTPDYTQPENRNSMPRPYVRFEMRPQESRDANGNAAFKDVVWALVMAPGGKDVLEKEAANWIDGLKQHAEAGRVPSQWPGEYSAALAAFIKGEELPEHGTPIKSWSALTPAQRKAILNANIHTVENLAACNDETRGRIGMGADGLIVMAKHWIKEAKGPGALAATVAQLAASLEDLKAVNERLRLDNAELSKLVPKTEVKTP